ncbi:MAG: hypothetical protein ACI9C9_002675 [Marivirga sp.]|jgi:hypothetical protein
MVVTRSATYTGARLDELAQIHLQDITKTKGILSITVTDEGEAEGM